MITPETKREIITALRKFRSPAKVARHLGLDLRDVLKVSDEIGGATRSLRPEMHGGQGRPELREFLVARKRAYQPWNNSDPEIARARASYEAGTHTMVTGRDGDWLLLYLIPQRRVTPRPDYFKPEF